ncbi:MAG: adenosine deaminase [Nannocystaceae bacterium]
MAQADPVTIEWLRAQPKAELHLHLEGSIAPALALDLARAHGLPLPGMEDGVEGVARAFVFEDFERFIRVFLAVSDCLREEEDFCAAVVALGERLGAQGIVAAEVTVTAMTHLRRGVSETALLSGLKRGREEAQRRFGVRISFIFDVVCLFPDQAEPTVQVALRGREAGVVGLGLAGPEARSAPVEAFARAFETAAAAGLRCVPHAEEHGGAARIMEVVERLHATRIGHGVRCLEDPQVVALLRDRGVALEVCPTSNVLLGVAPSLADHPLPKLLDAGLRVTLASDDPALFGTDMVRELARCSEVFGWTRETVTAICAEGIALAEAPGGPAL